MSAPPDDLGWQDILVLMAGLVILFALLAGLVFGFLFAGDWFWNNVVCEDWIVCQ